MAWSKSICEDYIDIEKPFSEEGFSTEISRFYSEFIQEMPQLKKFYPNVVVWIDAIIFRVDFGSTYASVLKQYTYNLKVARDLLEKKNPFNKCENINKVFCMI